MTWASGSTHSKKYQTSSTKHGKKWGSCAWRGIAVLTAIWSLLSAILDRELRIAIATTAKLLSSNPQTWDPAYLSNSELPAVCPAREDEECTYVWMTPVEGCSICLFELRDQNAFFKEIGFNSVQSFIFLIKYKSSSVRKIVTKLRRLPGSRTYHWIFRMLKHIF